MSTAATYSFGDIVLVPFPFTDQSGTKKRPAIIISSATYNTARIDLLVMAVTSQAGASTHFGEVAVVEWQQAGLLKPSVIKPVIATIERRLVLRKLGHLQAADQASLKTTLQTLMG